MNHKSSRVCRRFLDGGWGDEWEARGASLREKHTDSSELIGQHEIGTELQTRLAGAVSKGVGGGGGDEVK